VIEKHGYTRLTVTGITIGYEAQNLKTFTLIPGDSSWDYLLVSAKDIAVVSGGFDTAASAALKKQANVLEEEALGVGSMGIVNNNYGKRDRTIAYSALD
jgi:hypothetical protein